MRLKRSAVQQKIDGTSSAGTKQHRSRHDEVLRQNDTATAELAEAKKAKDEIAKWLEEATKERDALRSEIGNSKHMLEMDKIWANVSGLRDEVAKKGFIVDGLGKT